MILTEIKGIGPATAEKLKELGIGSVKALAEYLPTSYIDMSVKTEVADICEGGFYLFSARVSVLNSFRHGWHINYFKATAVSNNVKIHLIWYNQAYLYSQISTDKEYTFLGKAEIKEGKLTFTNPLFEPLGEEKKLKGVLPIYRTQGLIKQANIRKYILEAIKYTHFPSITEEKDPVKLSEAYSTAHSPKTVEEAIRVQQRIAEEDIINTILHYRLLRRANNKDKKRKYQTVDFNPLRKLLGYELTPSQDRAVKEIILDMSASAPMNRLLTGDVGSGKTIVALFSAYFAIKSGYQTLFLAPTSILAKQHYLNSLFLEKLGIKVRLLTSEVIGEERDILLSEAKNGEAQIIIGTHALLGEIDYKRIALVIADEQHRFGVEQRRILEDKGNMPDVLVMSATPIPRSLSLVMYQDLSLSSIDRRGALMVTTGIVTPEKRDEMFLFALDEINNGRQVYIVCPRIEDSEGVEMHSVKTLYSELRKGVFKNIEIALLHGKQCAEEKNHTMEEFVSGKLRALITTTVIEVGVDVKNASVMIIMDAERYGLAALHQLRGRIGRGEYHSYCFLYTDKKDNERLSALKKYTDGADIADADYDIRGGGDFLGLRQSGSIETRRGVPITRHMILKCRKIADEIKMESEKEELLRSIVSDDTAELVNKVALN
jgi:ATP-dependent DNA helicase RecG